MDDVFSERSMKVKFFGCGSSINKIFEHMIPQEYNNISIINTFSDKEECEIYKSQPSEYNKYIKRIYSPIGKTISISDLSSGAREIKEAFENTDVAVLVFDIEERTSIEQVNFLMKLCKSKDILIIGAVLVPDYRLDRKVQAEILAKIDKYRSKFSTLVIIESEKLKNNLESESYSLDDDFIDQYVEYSLEGLWELFDTLADSNTKEDIYPFIKGNKTASLSIVEAEGKDKFEDIVKLLLRNKYYGINKLKTQKLVSTIVIDNETTVDDVKPALETLAREVPQMDIIFTVMQEEGKEDFVKFIALAIN
jgi:cell division GTPase FtsZ